VALAERLIAIAVALMIGLGLPGSATWAIGPAGRCQPSVDWHQLHHAGPGGTRCRCEGCDGLVMAVSPC